MLSFSFFFHSHSTLLLIKKPINEMRILDASEYAHNEKKPSTHQPKHIQTAGRQTRFVIDDRGIRRE